MPNFDTPIQISTIGKVKEFKRSEQLVDWLEREQEAWQWVHGFNINIRAASSVITAIKQQQANEDGEFASHPTVNLINSHRVRDVFLRLPVSTSPMGKFVLAVKEERSETAAAGVLEALSGQQVGGHPQLPEHRIGQVLGVLRMEGFTKSSLKTALGKWDDLNSELDTIKDDAATAVVATSEQLSELVDSHNALQEQLRDVHASTIEEMKTEYGDLLTGQKERYVDIEKAFKEKLQLEGPVTYWNKKGERHKKSAIYWGALLGLALALGSFGFLFLARMFLVTSAGDLVALEFGQVTALAIGAIPFVIFLRLLIRNFLGHMHLYEDASMRSKMVSVYQALIAEGESIAEEDRRIVLEAIFRPTATSFAKEERIPMGGWSSIAKAMKS